MTTLHPTTVLIGLESAGKSAIFRHLTGETTGDETNFRGSTVRVRMGQLADGGWLVDTPGIRVRDDSLTTRLALQQMTQADAVLLVSRGTHARQELEALFQEMGSSLYGHKVALAITFADKASPALSTMIAYYRQTFGIPVALVNARRMNNAQRARLIETIRQAEVLHQHTPISFFPDAPIVQPQQTWFEHAGIGPWLALLTMILLFATPVYLAYLFANWVQPFVDGAVIRPLASTLAPLAAWAPALYAILAGNYGLLTLGWYSFLWAFPVVLLIGVSVAFCDETGLKDRIAAALDPWLRIIGLNGRDLAPVLSGFGCNVVAVFQSRACSHCTRKSCISLIAFGSACSYQIGASLSLFNTAQAPWLFAPYLSLLFLAGAIHTRVWNSGLADVAAMPLSERAFLQKPTWRGVWWRVRAVLRQFLGEAMPIFFAICTIGALFDYLGVMSWLAQVIEPTMGLFGLPGEVAPGVIFSMIRKDGLLALNQGNGVLLATLSIGQVFVLVYLASTLTACLVTLWTVWQEVGGGSALVLAGRQAATSLVSSMGIAAFINLI